MCMLIYCIVYFIGYYGVYFGEILVVMFINKVVVEMCEWVGYFVLGVGDLWMSIFYLVGVWILWIYGEYIGLRCGFVIYDDDDQFDIIKEVMGSIFGIGVEMQLCVICGIIDCVKSNLWMFDDFDCLCEFFISGLLCDVVVEVYCCYEVCKKGQNVIDFGDLIIEMVWLFKEVFGVFDKVQNKVKFIYVDEYQDMNWVQYELMWFLVLRDCNFLVVGDFDQLIYKFCGVDI